VNSFSLQTFGKSYATGRIKVYSTDKSERLLYKAGDHVNGKRETQREQTPSKTKAHAKASQDFFARLLWQNN
jgi:hypothetical protein